jgi:chorismate mutase-like protein
VTRGDRVRYYRTVSSLPGLKALRESIDEIDRRILELLHRRVELVLQVGELKRQHQAKIYDPERERSVLDALSARTTPPLEAQTVRRVFERIIDESRSIEQRHVKTRE